jgi:hypothetical protein
VGDVSDALAVTFEVLLGRLPDRRAWVISSPQLVDYIDELPGGEQHNYGGVLEMYSAFPPWDKQLPKSVDASHFEEVSLILDELCRLTKQFNCTIVLQLDRTQMGYIRNGELDRSIQIGLIDEWKKALDRG